jgi:hypothetical protein
VRAWLKSKFPGSETTLLGTIDIHVATRTAVLDYKHLRDMSDVAVLFDILAEQGIATVNIEFHTEDSSVTWDEVDFLDDDGKAVEIDIEDLEEGCFSDAFNEHWSEYASEAIVGDTDRPHYAHEGTYFQDASGMVTFTERRIDLKATARVEVISEEEEEVEESWDVGKTDSEAAYPPGRRARHAPSPTQCPAGLRRRLSQAVIASFDLLTAAPPGG